MDSKAPTDHSVHLVEEKGSVEPVQELHDATVDSIGIDEQSLIRKIDWRLIPWFVVLYLLSFLDRTSIGNARLYNLEGDLKISDSQYLISLTVFFFSYALFEVPSNIFLKRLRPSVWFFVLMSMWGVMKTLQGLTHNFGGLVALRFMLGAFEAGLFPGMAYYLSCWYKRKELGVRPPACDSTQVSDLPRFASPCYIVRRHLLGHLEDRLQQQSQTWMESQESLHGRGYCLATILAGIASIWIVQDFPDSAKFLTETERAFMIRRLQGDDQFSAAGEKLQLRNILIWKKHMPI
ncbi:putative MFS transporter [Mycena crocata]|nr:putative MFS transporter [Mycena crocata]